MADSTPTTSNTPPPVEESLPAAEVTADARPRPNKPRGPPLHQIYALPAPIRTFPLPSFYPNNPISLFHLVYAWAKQVLSPPPAEPSIIHTGIWDPESRSVHITDPVAVRALWEQGFYGKGNLSRSEPNWLKREQIRRGAAQGDVSEQRTALRREERRQVKWERARIEQEALERTRREEAGLTASGGEDPSPPIPPILPAEVNVSLAKAESIVVSEEAILRELAPEEVVDATEPVIEQPAVIPSGNDEEPAALANGTKVSHTHNTPSSLAPDHVVQITAIAVSQDANPVPSVNSNPPPICSAPVGPLELLALPNSLSPPAAAAVQVLGEVKVSETHAVRKTKAPVGPLELLALTNSETDLQLASKLRPMLTSAVAEAIEEPVTKPVVSTPTLETPAEATPRSKSPVGPLELLALPNSLAAKPCALNGITVNPTTTNAEPNGVSKPSPLSKSPVGPLELLALPNSLAVLRAEVRDPAPSTTVFANGSHVTAEPQDESRPQDDDPPTTSFSDERPPQDRPPFHDEPPRQDGDLATTPEKDDYTNGSAHMNGHTNGSIFGAVLNEAVKSEVPVTKHAVPEGAEEKPPKRRRKSVRFSDTVESTTFLHCDPPSPERSAAKRNGAAAVPVEAVSIPNVLERPTFPDEKPKDAAPLDVTAEVENKEHLQLSAEEAFFLSYGLGAVSILDPATNKPIPREQLLGLFRSHSYFPPRQDLKPNDPFLVHYAVYHHFRSLGWVPRHGIKFGVDWMLYTRGPVFDHAEFGLIVMPSYSHPQWKELGQEAPRKSWHWLHGVNRVLSHVLKSLVLIYVDVPPPDVFDAAMAAGGISAALKEYTVREFMVRRWSSNRNR